MEHKLAVEEIRPGLFKIKKNEKGHEHVRQVLSHNLISQLMDVIDRLPTLGRDITRMEAMQQLGMLPK